MKIFFIVRNTFPYGLATTARVMNYCKGFIENNIDCEVIIPIAIERYGEPVKNAEYKGVYERIPYQYISRNTRRSKYLIYRKIKDIFDYIRTLYYLYCSVSSKDIILVYEGGCLWCYMLCIISKLKKAHIVMELNELPYGTEVETNSMKKKRAIMLKKVFSKFDGFIAISEALAKLAHEYSPHSKIIKVPIIVDTTISKDVKTIVHARPYLFHSGSLFEQKDGIVGMLEAFAIANKALNYKLDYILTGFPERSRDFYLIQNIIKKYGIGKYVHFVGYLEIKKLREYQKNCVAVIINKYQTEQNKYCFSTKLGEYLAFAKPIIITKVGEAMNYLNTENSYIVNPNSSIEIADKIIEIVENRDKAQIKGTEGYRLATKIFSYKYQGVRIAAFFRTIIGYEN